MLGNVELRIQPAKGKERIVEATPEAVESALFELGKIEFIVVSDDHGRFMQDNGTVLEHGENVEGYLTLLRASPGSVRMLGSRPAFQSFLAGTDEWRDLYPWKDVSDEVGSAWGQRLCDAVLILTLLGGLWSWLRRFDVL